MSSLILLDLLVRRTLWDRVRRDAYNIGGAAEATITDPDCRFTPKGLPLQKELKVPLSGSSCKVDGLSERNRYLPSHLQTRKHATTWL